MIDTLHTITEVDNIKIAKSIECDISDLAKHCTIKKNDITIISQNICSIYCNFDDFVITLSGLSFIADVIILTECHLNPDKSIPKLNGYNLYSTTIHINKNDGVAVYLKDTLKFNVKEIRLSDESCLQIDTINSTILCIYRSPSNKNAENFITSLSTHLDTVKSQNNIIIAGDININLIPKTNEQASYEYKNKTNYLDMLSVHGILPGHVLPTRKKSCLDHFMLKINKKKVSAFIAVLSTTNTDHFTTFLTLTKAINNQNITKKRTTIDFQNALKHLEQQNLPDLLFCQDPNVVVERLMEKLQEMEKFFFFGG